MLFTPDRHERLAGHEFGEEAARDAIARIVERAEADVVDGVWPLDDEERVGDDEGPAKGLHYGAAGIAWSLGELGHARALAQHAAAQVEERFERRGHARHGLFTGDEGVAMCLAACITGDARFPIADYLI